VANGQPVLIMIQGPEPGSIYKLPDNRVTTIGRSSRNTIPAVSRSVSRFHCEVAWVNGAWVLTDLNSKKGTMLNGEWVQGRTRLKPGDLIRLSSTIFRFDLIDEDGRSDNALLAIKGAELDGIVKSKQEATGRIEDIIVRSRLDAESAIIEPAPRRLFGASVLFVAAVTLLVGVAVLLALLWARGRLPGPEASGQAGPPATAGEPEPPGPADQADAVPGAQPPGSPAGQADAPAVSASEALEQGLARVAEHEADGDYAAALSVCDELARMELDAAAAALVSRRRELTSGLARAFFDEMDRRARERAERGDRAGARELYRTLAVRVGLEDLSIEARRRAVALQ